MNTAPPCLAKAESGRKGTFRGEAALQVIRKRTCKESEKADRGESGRSLVTAGGGGKAVRLASSRAAAVVVGLWLPVRLVEGVRICLDHGDEP